MTILNGQHNFGFGNWKTPSRDKKMKIVCTVEIVNRALPTLSLPNKKGVKSSLTIGKSPDGSIFLLHQTNQNVPGNKFKVSEVYARPYCNFVSK